MQMLSNSKQSKMFLYSQTTIFSYYLRIIFFFFILLKTVFFHTVYLNFGFSSSNYSKIFPPTPPIQIHTFGLYLENKPASKE